MKPLLAIGLGNPLMGDDGVGCAVAEQLASDPRLPEGAEVICGGSDLLRYAGEMEGRRRVVVIDAIQGDTEPGSVEIFEGALSGLGGEQCSGEQLNDRPLNEKQDHVHNLSAVQAIRLLRILKPLRCTLVGISISSAELGTSLSPTVAAHMPAILDNVLQELSRCSSEQ